MTAYFIPILFAIVFIYTLFKKVKPYDSFVDGAKNAAILAMQIMAVADEELAAKLDAARAQAKAEVLAKDEEINKKYKNISIWNLSKYEFKKFASNGRNKNCPCR